MEDITVISAHYKDFPWIELLIAKIKLNTEMSKVHEILIINQDRCESARVRLQGLDERVRVVEYPRSEKHFQLQGHDHAAVLNKAVLEAAGAYICIFDSDAHPISRNWLEACCEKLTRYDAILAKSPYEAGPHPCFMVLKKEHARIPLSFDERLFEDGMDTGRLIGAQLCRAGQRVYYAEPTACFSGLWGTTYLDAVYHHGNGSFHAAGPLLTAQVTWSHHFFRKRVLRGKRYQFDLPSGVHYRFVTEYVRFKDRHLKPMKSRLCRVRDKIIGLLSRRP